MNELSDFVASVVSAHGGEVEQSDGQLELLVPESLQTRLGLPDQLTTVSEADRGEDDPSHVRLQYGTVLLENAVGLALEGGRVAAIQVELPPGPSSTRGAVDRQLAFPNAVFRVTGEHETTCDYWVWTFRVVAEADDRREHTCHVCLSESGASCPALTGLIHAHVADAHELPGTTVASMTDSLRKMYPRAVDAALADLTEHLASFRMTVERHHQRDVERVCQYFADLRNEMDVEVKRSRAGRDSVREEKLAALEHEQDAKLAALQETYRVRISLEPRALLLARLPVIRCELQVRRRKGERAIHVVYNRLAKQVDPLACEACGSNTHAPGICDAKLHVLCDACLVKSGGNKTPTCPGCAGRRPPSRLDAVGKRHKIALTCDPGGSK